MSDFCDPIGYSQPDSSVHGISQARVLEWVAIFFSRGSFKPRDRACVSFIKNYIYSYFIIQQLFSLLFSIYPFINELKSFCLYKKICLKMFTAALMIVTKTYKQPKCTSVSEYVNKLWYIQTMKYHSVRKRNELSSEKTWRNLKCILLCGRGQFEYCIQYWILNHCMIPTIWHSRKLQTMETLKGSVGCCELKRGVGDE